MEGEIGFLDCCLPCLFLMALLSPVQCVDLLQYVVTFFLTLSHWQAKSMALWSAHTCFLKIVSVWTSVCVCVFVCFCMCVSTLKAINN